jgi:hypothetical protein
VKKANSSAATPLSGDAVDTAAGVISGPFYPAEGTNSETNKNPLAASKQEDDSLVVSTEEKPFEESDLDNRVAIGYHNQPAINLPKDTRSPAPQTPKDEAKTADPRARAVRAYHIERRPNDRVVVIEYDKGPAELRSGGTRTWRNHNPGNLAKGDLSNFEGAIGSDDKFAIFPDDDTGLNAMYGLVYELRDAGKTVDQAIETWAPPNENNTPKYEADVHRWTGFSGTEKLSQLTDRQIDSFVNAIRRKEDWQPGRVIYDE